VEGVAVEETFRYTRVWHQRSDGWKIVSGQMTIVAR